jgi:transposase InsO family protein
LKYAFIRDELARACTVRMACRLLEVSPSGYYRFLKAPVAARKVRRLAVEDAVVRIHAESRRIYGAPKIAHELPRLGVSAHRNTVSRIMQEHGIRAKSVRKWRPTTTQSGHGHGASPDLLGRDFAADGPNRKWLCDITYVPTDEGFLYLAGVMDAWSRSIVGWSMSDSLHATVALDALRMAVARRNPPRGVVHHSDRGVQYACRECRDLLEEHGMEQSMSRSGNCYDNAMMESLWATLKKELVHGRRFRTHEEARLAVFEWIEVWYQRTRIHGSLGYVSPEAFEAAARAG